MPCSFHQNRPFHYQNLDPGCPYGVSENDLFFSHSIHWCEFHLPMENDYGNKSPKAGWDEKRIKKFNEKIFSIIEDAKEKGETCDLSGVVFPGEINFGAIQEFPEILFFKAQFNRHTWFNNAHFEQWARFDNAQFKGPAMFDDAHFEEWTSFDNAQFKGPVTFDNAQFKVETGFNNAHFEQWARFDNAQFKGSATFDDAHFEEWSSFSNTQFKGKARFYNAQFKGMARFDHVQFKGETWFNNAHFEEWIRFDNAQFKEGANFSASTKSRGERENAIASFSGIVNFSSAEIKKFVTFKNRNFLDTTDFSNCTFHQAPEFHNSQLHQDTDFDGAQFLDITSAGAVRAYRTLKRAMEDVRAYEEQGKFYALEQQSLRNKEDTDKWKKRFSLWYEESSSYGQDFVLPLRWLAKFSGVFFVIYLAANISSLVVWNISNVLAFTVQQVVRPFSAWFPGNIKFIEDYISEDVVLIQLLATVQSLLSIAFLALFVLALRWNFKRG